MDMFHHIFVDVSMVYFYVGLLLITLGIAYVSQFVFKHMMKQSYEFQNDHRHVKINLTQIEKPIITNESFMDWIVMICKRFTEKDDKEDGVHSYFNQHNKIRGGQLCLQTTYSHFLKKLV